MYIEVSILLPLNLLSLPLEPCTCCVRATDLLNAISSASVNGAGETQVGGIRRHLCAPVTRCCERQRLDPALPVLGNTVRARIRQQLNLKLTLPVAETLTVGFERNNVSPRVHVFRARQSQTRPKVMGVGQLPTVDIPNCILRPNCPGSMIANCRCWPSGSAHADPDMATQACRPRPFFSLAVSGGARRQVGVGDNATESCAQIKTRHRSSCTYSRAAPTPRSSFTFGDSASGPQPELGSSK